MFRRFPANFTLPSIYDETLSYEDQLRKMIEWMKELDLYVKNVLNETNGYTDEQIKIVKSFVLNEIGKAENRMENLINSLSADIATNTSNISKNLEKIDNLIYLFHGLSNELDIEIKKVNDRIDQIATEIPSLATKEYVDSHVEYAVKISKTYADGLHALSKLYTDQLRNHVNDLIAMTERRMKEYSDLGGLKEKFERELADKMLKEYFEKMFETSEYSQVVYNIAQGKRTPLQVCLNDYWGALRPFALDYNKLERKKLTYDEIEKLGCTWVEWDLYNGYITSHLDTRVFSPISSERKTVYECLVELTDFLRWNAKTVSYWAKHEPSSQELKENGVDVRTWAFTREFIQKDSNIREKISKLLEFKQLLWSSPNPLEVAGAINIDLSNAKNVNGLTLVHLNTLTGERVYTTVTRKKSAIYTIRQDIYSGSNADITPPSQGSVYDWHLQTRCGINWQLQTVVVVSNPSFCSVNYGDPVRYAYKNIPNALTLCEVWMNTSASSIFDWREGFIDTDSDVF